MVEQQRLDHGLEQVHQVVVTADVGQLVRQDRLDLRRPEAGHGARRQEHDGSEPADRRGHVHPIRLAQEDGARHSHALREARHRRAPKLERLVRGSAQTAHQPPAPDQAQRQKRDAEAPADHEPRRHPLPDVRPP